jgi:hypothetical protein
MYNYKEKIIWDECYSIALDFYGLLKSAAEDYNGYYFHELKDYKYSFLQYAEEFTEAFKDAEEKRQSLSDETLYDIPIKDILKTLESHGFIFDKDIFSKYARGFKFNDYLEKITFYHCLKDNNMPSSVDSFFRKENFKNMNSIYRFLKLLADHVFNSYCEIYRGGEIDELIETILTFTEILKKFNDIDENIKMNNNTVLYGQPLKIILNDLRKLGLIIDKSSVGSKIDEDLDIDMYELIENTINMTEDFLIKVKNCFTQPLYKEAQKSLDKEVKRLILCKHMPSLYKLIL